MIALSNAFTGREYFFENPSGPCNAQDTYLRNKHFRISKSETT